MAMPLAADARSVAGAGGSQPTLHFVGELFVEQLSDFNTTQGCMSLSQAVDSVRRRGNVKQVISAETKVSGGREVHHVKVLTKDGKVKTHRIQGC
jgi:hypothetical protein